MECPKCNYCSITSFEVCPNCGIIISKIKHSSNTLKPNINTKIVSCLACGNAISANAETCPSCGEPNKKPFLKNSSIYIIILLSIIIIILTSYIIIGNNKSSSTNISSRNGNSNQTGSTSKASDDLREIGDLVELAYFDTYWKQTSDFVCSPTVKYKIRNISNKKLNNISLRAVFLKNNAEIFSQASDMLYNFDTGLTSECKIMTGDIGYNSMAGVRGKTLTMNLYASINGREKLIKSETLTDVNVKDQDKEMQDTNCPSYGRY
jgi:hypothetical protein